MYHFEKELEENKKEQTRLRDREISDLKFILKYAEGRRFLWRLLELAGVMQCSFTGNSETFFREGKRSVGLAFLDDLFKYAPTAFTQMQQEYYSELKSKGVNKDD